MDFESLISEHPELIESYYKLKSGEYNFTFQGKPMEGIVGQQMVHQGYLYICTAPNIWNRVKLSQL